MIPSSKWFPSSLQERAAWFDNFNTQFATVGLGLGFAAPTITAVTNDNAAFQFLATEQVTVDSFKEAVRQFRIVLSEGAIGEPTPLFPDNPSAEPPVPVDTGIFQRLIELVDRIRVAPTYTPEIGALLGIIPANGGGGTPEGLMKPAIKASQSFDGYKFSVNVTRLGQPGYKVQVQRQGQTKWDDAAFATNNPCDVVVTSTTPGDPERVLVRAILLKNNTVIGEPSDPTYVTVNP